MFIFKECTQTRGCSLNNKERSFRFAQTASMYLSSSMSLSGLVQWNRFSNNSITQWLIGIFVRSYSSKEYLLMRKRGFLYPQPQTVSQTVWPMRGWDNWKGLGNLFNLSQKIRKRSNFKKLFCLTPIEKSHLFWWLL